MVTGIFRKIVSPVQQPEFIPQVWWSGVYQERYKTTVTTCDAGRWDQLGYNTKIVVEIEDISTSTSIYSKQYESLSRPGLPADFNDSIIEWMRLTELIVRRHETWSNIYKIKINQERN